jgi:hypothetical protein
MVYTYKQCEVDPHDPDGPCLDCKSRGREADCDKVQGIHEAGGFSESVADYNAIKISHQKLSEDVDGLKFSIASMENSIKEIGKSLSIIMSAFGLPSFQQPTIQRHMYFPATMFYANF